MPSYRVPAMFLYALFLSFIFWAIRRVIRRPSPLDRVPGPPSASLFVGNLLQLCDHNGWSFHREIAHKYGSVIKLNWLFNKPLLYIFDPLALEHILKDIVTYDQPSWFLDHVMMLGDGILSVTGETHRKQRRMLMPAFAPKHLRALVPVFRSVIHRLVDAIDARIYAEGTEIDMSTWMGRTALELIGQSGLGYPLDPLTEDIANPFADAAKHFVPVSTCSEMAILRQLVPYTKNLGPMWFRRWVMHKLPFRCLQQMIKITNTLHEGSVKLFQAKKAALEAGQSTDAKDIMSILLKANAAASKEERLPERQIIAQITSIILAAMDTTTNAMSRILHLLAEHPDVQAKLRHEILNARGNGGSELNYDQLHALPFLEAVCRETLRLHPPAIQIIRQTTRDSILPLSQPIRGTDGTLLSSIAVPQGTNMFIAIMACNRNEAIWGPDANEWKPERWLAPLPAAVTDAGIPGIHSNSMTFIGGGRSCIGFMFTQLEIKVMLSELLANFAFELSDKPIVWNLNGITYPTVGAQSTKPEMWMKVRRLCEGGRDSS
ncbi:cytochrome P450 [Trametes polyzona]|nr:cytochrome P450 [Trametes polyzona]